MTSTVIFPGRHISKNEKPTRSAARSPSNSQRSRARAFGHVVNREDTQASFVVHFDRLLRNVRRYLAARDDASLDGDAASYHVPVNSPSLLRARLAALLVV